MSAPEVLVSIARLPVTARELFGRERELAWLDDCWSTGVRVASIVAWGGVGKSALVNAWLRRMDAKGWDGAERVFGWSFYSQGTDRLTSSDAFVDVMLRELGDADPTQGSPWDKGERLARLVRKQRMILVLDGLEPLQWGPAGELGRLKDPALQALVRELGAQNKGLCLITSRITVADLEPFDKARELALHHLSPEAGAQLLVERGAKGTEEELRAAAKEYDGHCLALTLLGSYVRKAYKGDIRKHDIIPPLEGKPERRMMAIYERWFAGKPEMAILRMLGLFDRPAPEDEIAALRAKPSIAGMTELLDGLSESAWNEAITTLRDVGLLAAGSEIEDADELDAHPLVREHFGEQLRHEHADAWQEGHRRLYEHLKKKAKPLPETLEEMAPLYAAVVHGCLAGEAQTALAEVFVARVRRQEEAFSLHKLGAFGSEVAALSAFFDPLWKRLTPGLSESLQAFVLNEAGVSLRALGRLPEAAGLLRVSVKMGIAQEDWKEAAIRVSNLSELLQTRGELCEALAAARQCVELADKSGDDFERTSDRATLAAALLALGRRNEAAALFEEAERIQEEWQPAYPLLYSLRGFQYCDLLLDQGREADVLARAAQTLVIAKANLGLLSNALDHLSLGRAHLRAVQRYVGGDLAQAEDHLQQAVDGLRRAGGQDDLPLGLFARADLHLHTHAFAEVRRDLDEAFSLATRCGLRLHEADAHLRYALLALAEQTPFTARAHLAKARALIEATGYHRRDAALAELEAMNKNQLLDALNALLPAQIEELLFKLGVPPAFLPGAPAPPGERIIATLRWAEQQNRLADVERLYLEVTAPAAPPGPFSPPAPAQAPAHTHAPAQGRAHVDFLIITALEEERDAVLQKLPSVEKLDRDGTDTDTYYEARVETKRKDRAVYRVIVTMLPDMGPIKGAIKAKAVIARYQPAHVLMVGIAGGLVDEIALGDVMVASQIADYTLGKIVDKSARQERWVAYPGDANLLDAVKNFSTGWEDLVSSARPAEGKPKRRVGVVASGGDVIASKDQIALYRADWPKLVGVEMEGGGVAAGLHDDIQRPRFLMIRGVSDLADGEGNAEVKAAWRAHACDVAAAYAIGLLRDGPVPGRADPR
jgi:nucleoside phosphorylase